MAIAFKPKGKAKSALVVYVEPGRIEYVTVAYGKGAAGVGSAKAVVVDREESTPAALKRLRIGERARRDTDLVLFVSKAYYQFQKEFFPESLGDEMDKILEYSMAENLFHDPDKQYWAMGDPEPVLDSVKVPIFSMERELHAALGEALEAGNFKNFVIAPVSAGLGPLLSMLADGGPGASGEPRAYPEYACLGRMDSGGALAVHRFSRGVLVDSMEAARGGEAVKMLVWTIRGLNEELHLFFSPDETPAKGGKKSILPVQSHSLTKPFVHYLACSLFDMDRLTGFDSVLKLRKRRVPPVAWVVAALILAYAVFGYMQFGELDGLRSESAQADKVLAGLKKEWEPVNARRLKVEEMTEQASELLKQDAPKVDALELLTILTEATPKDTWLKQIYLKGETMTLTGESGDALQYRTILSNIEQFGDVRFASTVHHIPSENKDRFTLRLTVLPDRFKDAK